MTARPSGRGPAALAVATLAVLTLAGCAGGDPALTARPPADAATHPVVAGKQATDILDKVDAAVTGTAEPARVTGPYLQIRTARAKQAAARKLTVPAVTVPTRTRVVVPSSTTWPRFFLAVGSRPKAPTPIVRLLVSTGPRAPYGLWAETSMLPGARLPEVAPDGEALPPTTTEGLLRSPADALAHYAGLLTQGAAAPDAKLFAPNAFTSQVTAQVAADRKALAAVATLTAGHAVRPGTTFAVRTADGGALVVGELVETVTLKVKPDAGTITVKDPDVAALAGRGTFSKQVVRTSAELLTLYIPPKSGTITLVAAQKADLAVAGT